MPIRDDAQRLLSLLIEVRDARADARDFAWFERRDDLAELGIPHSVSDLFDPTDDAALERLIADVRESYVASDTRRDEGGAAGTTSVRLTAPPMAKAAQGVVNGIKALGGGVQSVADNLSEQNWYARNRPAPSPRAELPASYDFSKLSGQFARLQQDMRASGKETFQTVIKRPFGSWELVDKVVGNQESAPADGLWSKKSLRRRSSA